jgi:predicted nucleic acid-binding protein
MKFLVDTSVLVSVDRHDGETRDKMEALEGEHTLYLSVVGMMEILTGANLRLDKEVAIKRVKKIVAHMDLIPITQEIAEKASEINAYLIQTGQIIEVADMLMSASCIVENLNGILTFNKDHFVRIPALKDSVFTPAEATIAFNTSQPDQEDK